MWKLFLFIKLFLNLFFCFRFQIDHVKNNGKKYNGK